MKSKEELQKLLVVVDMVNGFAKKGVMADPYINHITPELIKLIKKVLGEEEAIAFIKDTHYENSTEFKKFPPHCIKGSGEEELIDELKEYEKYGLSYEKNSTSTIFARNFLQDIESMKKLKEVIITGCCTDICVLNLVIPLINYFDENNKEVQVTVRSDLVETYNSPNHNREEYNEMALKLMRQAGAKVEGEN
jgi:nicotinamidase-related amidase